MKQTLQLIALLLFAGLIAGPALAGDLYIFPSKGQSQDQMERDKYDCYQWAKQQTGFDPMERPTASSPPPQQQARRGGAFRGAAVGAGVGAIAKSDGSRSKGAAKGAAAGALVGGARTHRQRRQDEQARQQWEQEQAAQYNARRSEYNRAYGACLEGKGYTVK